MRYCLISIRKATITKTPQNPRKSTHTKKKITTVDEDGETGTLVHCWSERKTVQLLWKTVW